MSKSLLTELIEENWAKSARDVRNKKPLSARQERFKKNVSNRPPSPESDDDTVDDDRYERDYSGVENEEWEDEDAMTPNNEDEELSSLKKKYRAELDAELARLKDEEDEELELEPFEEPSKRKKTRPGIDPALGRTEYTTNRNIVQDMGKGKETFFPSKEKPKPTGGMIYDRRKVKDQEDEEDWWLNEPTPVETKPTELSLVGKDEYDDEGTRGERFNRRPRKANPFEPKEPRIPPQGRTTFSREDEEESDDEKPNRPPKNVEVDWDKAERKSNRPQGSIKSHLDRTFDEIFGKSEDEEAEVVPEHNFFQKDDYAHTRNFSHIAFTHLKRLLDPVAQECNTHIYMGVDSKTQQPFVYCTPRKNSEDLQRKLEQLFVHNGLVYQNKSEGNKIKYSLKN